MARTEYGVPSRILMKSAGRTVAHAVFAEFPAAQETGGGVLFAAGAGNNGGGGWVLARALHAAGVSVWVAAADPKTDDAIDNRALARVDGVRELAREEAWPQAAVAVDALLGTGAAGPTKGDVLSLSERLAAYGAPILAGGGAAGARPTSGGGHGPPPAPPPGPLWGPPPGPPLARRRGGQGGAGGIGVPPPP